MVQYIVIFNYLLTRLMHAKLLRAKHEAVLCNWYSCMGVWGQYPPPPVLRILTELTRKDGWW